MKNTIRMAVYLALWVLAYFAFFVGVTGARNVIVFYVWAYAALSGLASLTSGETLVKARASSSQCTRALVLLWCALFGFVWTGSFMHASAALCAILAVGHIQSKLKEVKA